MNEANHLNLNTVIETIATGWIDYRTNKTRSNEHPVDQAVTKHFPAIIEEWVNSPETNGFNRIKKSPLIYQGSAGQGNISVSPWVGAFDTRNTSSAQYGLYPVFLFSTDAQKLILNIGIGTTQFTKTYGENEFAREKITQSIGLIRSIFTNSKFKPSNILEQELNLGAEKKDKLLYNYQKGSIFSFSTYDINHINEEKIKNDFLSLLQFYQTMIEDPLLPTADKLILRDIPEQKIITTYNKFDPKKFDKKKSAGFASSNSKEIGDVGEAYVLKCEKEKLINADRKDLAEKIIPHYKNLDFCGWDITSYDENGNEVYIEVKSTTGPNFYGFIMTANEWSKAHSSEIADKYKIYRVLNVLSKTPQVYIIDNIKELLNNNELEGNPISYKVEKV